MGRGSKGRRWKRWKKRRGRREERVRGERQRPHTRGGFADDPVMYRVPHILYTPLFFYAYICAIIIVYCILMFIVILVLLFFFFYIAYCLLYKMHWHPVGHTIRMQGRKITVNTVIPRVSELRFHSSSFLFYFLLFLCIFYSSNSSSQV